MMLRAALASLLILWAGPAPAQTQADPVAYVQAIYARYQHNNPPAWYDQNYSARLRKLIDADQKEANGEAGKFDWDPIINAQDWKLKGFKVTLVASSDDSATVDAAFINLGSKQRMRFSLVREKGKWAIDDVQALEKARWDMVKVFEGAPDAFPDEQSK